MIEVALWRCRIGCFMQRPPQQGFKIPALTLSRWYGCIVATLVTIWCFAMCDSVHVGLTQVASCLHPDPNTVDKHTEWVINVRGAITTLFVGPNVKLMTGSLKAGLCMAGLTTEAMDRRQVSTTIVTLLVIGGVELNPGPLATPKPTVPLASQRVTRQTKLSFTAGDSERSLEDRLVGLEKW